MNNSKIWLVVKPTVGIPLFLSAVAIGSFAVHVAVVSNTSWYSDYMKGQPLGAGDQATAALANGAEAQTVKFVQSPEADGAVYVVMPDGTQARLVFEEQASLAALERPGQAPVEH